MTGALKGSCFCKAVTYEAAGLSTPIGYCHCETCRKTHSAPFVPTAITPFDGFKWTQGVDIVASIESSAGKFRYFCPKCGTHLMAEVTAEKRRILRVASLDSTLPVDPVIHIWTSEKADYFEFEDGLPRLPESVPS